MKSVANRFASIAAGLALFGLDAMLQASPEPSPVLGKLLQSFEDSAGTSYTCMVNDSQLLEETGAASGKYYHLALGDGTSCRRIDLFDASGKLLLRFLQNREGSYAFASGKWGKIAEILPLHHFDLMYEPFDDFEIELSAFSMRTILYDGMNCTEITMSTRPDAKAIQWGGNPEVAIFGLPGIDNVNSRIYATRPMRRVFVISPDNLLLSRSHYNLKNQLICQWRLEKVDSAPDLSVEDFKPTGKIVGDYLLLNSQFMGQYYSDLYKSRLPQNFKTDTTYYAPSRLERFADWLFSSHASLAIVYTLRIAGVLCLAVVGVACWRRRRQGGGK